MHKTVARFIAGSRCTFRAGTTGYTLMQQPRVARSTVARMKRLMRILVGLVESPQWLADLGDAYATHGPYIQTTIQQLRTRAQASGYLQSNGEQNVYQQAGQIYVQPVYPTVVYVPYYNPYVVYGTWWWPAY